VLAVTKPVVSLVTFDDPYRSLRKALELCDGFAGLDRNDRILIKPNLVSWDFDLPFPPYGVVVTSAVMAALVSILYEEGFRRLTIGEGPLMIPKTRGRAMFTVLGYDILREKYGVQLADFNEEKFEPVDFGGLKLSVARRVLEADKIINLPVLKTHNQCQVSLGIKNLKGCLDRKSKTVCHGKELDLDHTFPHITEKLPVALTVTDGVFALARGPGHTGEAVRKNLLLASRNVLACDIAGAELMSFSAGKIKHLAYYAALTNGAAGLEEIEIRGEPLEKHRFPLEHDWEWTSGNTGPLAFQKKGITGLAVRKYDSSLCTGCSMMYNPMLILLMSAFQGAPFPNVEVITGKRQKASPGFDYSVLYGQCACSLNRDNPAVRQAIPIGGCPPDLEEFMAALREAGINCDYKQYIAFRHYLFNRYRKEDGFDPALFSLGG
jgi:uncharacterized protein (DUF362 family)